MPSFCVIVVVVVMANEWAMSKFTVRGLTEEHTGFLRNYAQKHLGTNVVNKAILALINEKMLIESKSPVAIKLDKSVQAGEKKRIQLSLNQRDYNNLLELSSCTDSSPQHFIICTLLNGMYNEKIRLLGSEIEQLKKSNYELHKIGVNINQIARALNAEEKATINLNLLHREIDKHVSLVKSILKDNVSRY